MESRLVGAVRSIALVVAGGVIVAFVAFALTSAAPFGRYLGPICVDDVARPGFDIWTGEPHGRIVDQYQCPPDPPEARVNVVRFAYPVPDQMVGRRAMPLPVGFIAGCVLTIGLLAIFRVRRRPGATGDAAERDSNVAA